MPEPTQGPVTQMIPAPDWLYLGMGQDHPRFHRVVCLALIEGEIVPMYYSESEHDIVDATRDEQYLGLFIPPLKVSDSFMGEALVRAGKSPSMDPKQAERSREALRKKRT